MPSPTDLLPTPRAEGYRIEVVCSGNICRSPSAEVVLTRLVADAGLEGVVVRSSGIGDWHAGDPMDSRSATILRAAGFDPSAHRARQVTDTDLAEADLTLAMDRSHLRDLLARGADRERTLLFRAFDPQQDGDEVPDPYYGGSDGFEEVLEMVVRTANVIVDALRSRTTPSPGAGS